MYNYMSLRVASVLSPAIIVIMGLDKWSSRLLHTI